jgi:hypothetical protein
MSWLMNWITKINQDGHVAIGVLVFAVGAAIHVFHGLDASFVAFTTTVLGFLGGHAWVQSKGTPDVSPDSPSK